MKCPPIPKKLNKNDNIVVGVKQLIEENIATIPSLAVLAKKCILAPETLPFCLHTFLAWGPILEANGPSLISL
jgi:hypothetical protein